MQNVDSTDPNLKRKYDGIELNINARLPRGVRIFGGTSTEKMVTNSCSAADHDPNLLLFCDGAQNGIPWQTNLKLAACIRCPGTASRSAARCRRWPASRSAWRRLQYGVFTAGTGFDRPNGLGTFWLVTPTHELRGELQGSCTPGARVIPGLNGASALVPLAAPGTEFTPRTNQVDFGASKTVKFGQVSITPKLDLFNAFNSGDYTRS